MAEETQSYTNPVLDLAIKRFKLAQEAESRMRQDGITADQFFLGEQWPKEVQQSRILSNRPCLVINQLKKFVRQVTNDMRMNRPSVKVIPVHDSDEETAEILEGVVRHIQVASKADIAYDTAGQSQVVKGFGYWRIITEFESPKSFDQVIRIKRIKNANTVYLDPNAMEPDNSDGKFAFIVEDMPIAEFKKKYPKAKAAEAGLSSNGDGTKDWQNNETVRVAEYFEVIEKEDMLCLMVDGQTMLKSEMKGEGYKEAKDAGFIKRERPTTTQRVVWRKITFCDVLEGGNEGQDWPGKYIPIVPVWGEDMDVDGKRYVQGMVFDAMDPQRQFNYMSTAMTEVAALAPRSPFILALGQVENLEQFWANANVQNFAYLPYNPVDVNGTVLPPPARNTAEAPIAAFGALVQKAGDDLKGVTGIYDAGLGKREGNQSGRAINALKQEGDVANFNYIDNLSRAILYTGKILLDLIPKIYDAPRVMQIVGEDDTVKSVHINTPMDAEGKPLPNGFEAAMAKIYDLSNAVDKYDVTVVVGPSFSTKRQEAAEAMTTLAQSYPPIMDKAGDLVVKAMDIPLNNEIAERLRPPGMEDDKDIPPAAQAKLQQMGQMMEQLTQVVNQLSDERDQKLLEISSKERMNASNNQNKLVIVAMGQEAQANQAVLSAELGSIQSDKAHAQQLEMQANAPDPQTAPQAA